MMNESQNAGLLGAQQSTAHYQGGTDRLSTELPLWLQAQAAQSLGTRHGEARTPEDLRIAFAFHRWPGSPELRCIYLRSADKAITSTARFQARHDILDTCDRIGGIHLDPDTRDLTDASADILEWEYCRSQKEHAYDIDHGPEPRLARFH